MNPNAIIMVPVPELEQFLNNLVNNAVKSAVESALLSISAGQEFYSAEQAGALLGLSPSLIRRELKDKALYAGTAVRYSRKDLLNIFSKTKSEKSKTDELPKRNDGKKVSVARKSDEGIKKAHPLSGFHKRIERKVEACNG